MASLQLTSASFLGLPALRSGDSRSLGASGLGADRRCFRGLSVRAATAVAPAYTSVRPLGDRVLVKIKTLEEKTLGGLILPSSAQTKPQVGEVVATGPGKKIKDSKVDVSVQTGDQVIYSKYAGNEIDLDGQTHLILRDEDIVGILETDDVKDLKPLNDRVLIQVAQAEDRTAGGVILTENVKEKPSFGTVIAAGPGSRDDEGKRNPLLVTTGCTVLYSKYAGSEFKGADGTNFIVVRESDIMAILS